jgi:hypothetical protein
MGFVMGMFVGGSVTLLHAAMSGGLKGINGMAVKRSEFGRHGWGHALSGTQRLGVCRRRPPPMHFSGLTLSRSRSLLPVCCCVCSAVGGGTAFGVIFAVGSLVRQ